MFAQEIARGVSAATAYARAGYRASDSNASTLKGKKEISERVSELLAARTEVEAKGTAEAIERTGITKEKLLNRLWSIGAGDGGPAVRALEMVGKELGMFLGASGSDDKAEKAGKEFDQRENVFDLEEMRAKYNVGIRAT